MVESNLPQVPLERLSGHSTDIWKQFEELLRASITVARISQAHNQRAQYLQLHLDGNALSCCFSLAEALQNDSECAHNQHHLQYACPNQIRKNV